MAGLYLVKSRKSKSITNPSVLKTVLFIIEFVIPPLIGLSRGQDIQEKKKKYCLKRSMYRNMKYQYSW